MTGDSTVIEALETQAELEALGGRVDVYLHRSVERARAFARPAVSGFAVGAAALGASGRTYLGYNVESARRPLHTTVHAEQCAVALASALGDHITEIATSAPPCGHCRQFLLRYAPRARVHVARTEADESTETYTVGELMPGRPPMAPAGVELDRILEVVTGTERPEAPTRRPRALRLDERAEVRIGRHEATVRAPRVEPADPGLAIGPIAAGLVWARERHGVAPDRVGTGSSPSGDDRQVAYDWSPSTILATPTESDRAAALLPRPFGFFDLAVEDSPYDATRWKLRASVRDALDGAALAAARAAFAPSTRSPSGVAIETPDGIATGGFVESSAFNPSATALAVALVLLAASGWDPRAVRRVAFAEWAEAPALYADWTREMVASLWPQARFRVVSARLEPSRDARDGDRQ